MPVGILSDSDFERELNRLNRKPDKKESHVIDIPVRGRKEGDNNVPDSLRKIIGETAITEGREAALDLASEFGISASSVSAYTNGATSTTTYNTPNQKLLGHINVVKRNRINKASKIMKQAMEAITEDKLTYADPKDLSSIAKDMSVIIKNLEPKETNEGNNTVNGPQFVIYAPQFKPETAFDVIEVKE